MIFCRKNSQDDVLSLMRQVAAGIVAAVAFAACATGVQQISGRPPNLFDKQMGSIDSKTRDPSAAEPVPDIFVRKRDVTVKPLNMPNETGSLFNGDDERNYLFTSSGPVTPGRFLTVDVVSNKIGKDKVKGSGKAKAKDAPAEPAPAGAAAGDKKAPDAFEQELIKSLPELEPANKDEMALLKRFKMRIVHRYDNGDALAEFSRDSRGEEQANQLTVQARVPYERLVAGEGLTTEDLFDVKFSESRDGDVLDRHSSSWEDEYSLRMSGFSEAKSKVAIELDDKRKQVQEAKEGLETRIKTLADERQQVAKQRDELSKKSDDTQTKIKGLEDKVKDQESTITNQQSELEKLKPENKPGDNKDGKSGK